jgi:hypothetical protein
MVEGQRFGDSFTTETVSPLGPLRIAGSLPERLQDWFHNEDQDHRVKFKGITEIQDSAWKAKFAQRHLDGIHHFVLEFYDDIVEVLCKSLVFGSGEFRIEDHSELSYYKPWPRT